jgi:hypothetical protein
MVTLRVRQISERIEQVKKLFLLLLLVPFISPVLAKNEVKHAAKTVDKVLDVGDKGKVKGGKPLYPGAQGQVNSEIKKATNPGQGGGKNNSLGGSLLGDGISNGNGKVGHKGKLDKEIEKAGKGGKNGKKGGKKYK